jgi:hypothetical protein
MNESSRRRLVGASLLVASFVGGIAVGVTAHSVVSGPTLRARAMSDMSPVLDQLQLSADQRRLADAILQRRTPRVEAMMLEMAAQFRAVSDSVDNELRGILTPAQRTRLDSLRRGSQIMLKRKVVGPGGTTTVDTLIATPRRD